MQIMRVAFIVSQFPSLSETFILDQITGLLDRGCAVDIYAERPWCDSKVHRDVDKYNLLARTHYWAVPSNKLWRLVKGMSLIMLNLHRKPTTLVRAFDFFEYGEISASLKLLYAAVSFLGRGPYDIVHCHHGPNGRLGVSLRDIDAVRGLIITTFHGYDVNMYPQECGEDIYEDLFNKGDLYTVNSNFTGSKIKELGCDENKIIRLPVGLKVSEFQYKEREALPGREIRVLTVARLVEKKGIEYSLKAIARVLGKHPNVRYRIVGDGPLREPLGTLIGQLDIQNNVELLGWKNQGEVRQLYNESHIFVLSSVTSSDGDQEGQGLVLQEAQAAGLPVVSTLHNGIPEGVLDGESGFLVPERDVDALADKLNFLIEHPELWPHMGRAGRKYVEERYDINTINDRLVEIYHQLLAGDLSELK